MARVLDPNRKGTPKNRRVRISLEDRPGNNFYRLISKYQLKPDRQEPIFRSLANILTIMEKGHETSYDDIRNLVIVKCESRIDMEIHFDRYRGCVLEPIKLYVKEFDKSHPMIDPIIPG